MTTGAGFAAPIITWMYQGAVAASGSMYVYQTGTTTLVSIYSDAGLTTPLSNPLNLDSNGQAVFYVSGQVNLRLDGYTGLAGAGTLIKSIDPVYPVGTASGFTTEATLASATTTDLGTASSSLIDITGTTTITGFGSSASLTAPLYFLRFTGALTLTYDATKMILPGSANITTAAGDTCVAQYMGSGNWKVLSYSPISGKAVVPPATPVINNYITGLYTTAQTFSSSTVASATFAAGQCADSGNAVMMSSGGSTLAWDVTNGNAAGGYQGGTTLPNSKTIDFYIITKSDNTTPAIFACEHTTTFAFPTGYTSGYKRLVDSRNTNSSGVLQASTDTPVGNNVIRHELATEVLDINGATPGNSSRTLYTLSVPLGIIVAPLIRYNSNRSTGSFFLVTSPSQTDVAPGSATTGNYYSYFTTVPGFDDGGSGTVGAVTGYKPRLTNTSGQIGVRQTAAATVVFYLVTSGWDMFR